MKIAELEKNVDLYSLIAKNHVLKKAGQKDGYPMYRVDPCPKCGSRGHFDVFPHTNSYCSRSDCCKGGSVYKYLLEIEGMSEDQAYQYLYELAGDTMTESKKTQKKDSPNRQEKPTIREAKEINFTNWISELYQKQTNKDKRYFISRGIALYLIEKYKLCVWHDGKGRRAIFPVWSNGEVVYYTGRALDGQDTKYKNAIGTAKIFNLDYLKQEGNEPIFITEGIVDALTLETKGYKAIALGGVQHASKLTEAIKKIPTATSKIFLTAFDNDDAGKKAAEGFPYKRLEIPNEYKDVNEWHIADLTAEQRGDTSVVMLKKSIEQQLKTATQPDAVSDYLNQAFFEDVEKIKPYKHKKTGFDNLDREMKGLFPGLYVIGGISSVGKTTFVHQLGDQLAEQGNHVIYFSLEQSKLEMVSKSIARMTAKINLNSAVPSIKIRSGDRSAEVIHAIDEYKGIANKVNVIEGNFNTDVNTIRNYVETYIRFNDVQPIVIIDYLQIMPSINDKFSDKQKIDTNVTELKRMSRDLDISVFVISSLNRGNYLAPIDFESFKESGGIEYTADVVWGLQLEIINSEIFNKKDKLKEKREKLKEAKAADPRQIELVCLKNRNGKPSFSCGFTYWSKFDFFEANKDGNKEQKTTTEPTPTKERKRI